uniref:Wsv440-like protein n=1 Tax=Trachysalambria curvirostris majanivirus TaxID=2984281 RepID=A0A9C7CE37_9VIRU|nr:MAG: wsv440-like protein [Trachysalambria curvirostris majanivirus]
METNIENIILWVSYLNCSCKNGERLHRLLSSLIDNIKFKRLLKELCNVNVIKSEICDIINNVKIYEFINTPLNFLHRFGINDIKTCLCNKHRENYKMSSCFILPSKNLLICPECVMSYINNYDMKNQLYTVIDYVSKCIGDNIEKREMFNLYKALLVSNRPPFNGSWVSLIIRDRLEYKDIVIGTINRNITATQTEWTNDDNININDHNGKLPLMPLLSGYILVSNKIQPSLRGRYSCYCSDLLYMFTYLSNENINEKKKFGVKPVKIKLIDDEYMLICYDVCFLNDILFGENEEVKFKHRSENRNNIDKNTKIDKMNHYKDIKKDDNNIDTINIGSILLSIYNNKNTIIYNNGNENKISNIPAKAAALLGDYRNNESMGINDIEKKTLSNTILPPPNIIQTTLDQLQRKKPIASISTKDMDGNILSLRVLQIDNVIYPYSCTLLPPPIIIRKSYNNYMFILNICNYFDSIEISNKKITIPSKENKLYQEILMIINDIREISLKLNYDNETRNHQRKGILSKVKKEESLEYDTKINQNYKNSYKDINKNDKDIGGIGITTISSSANNINISDTSNNSEDTSDKSTDDDTDTNTDYDNTDYDDTDDDDDTNARKYKKRKYTTINKPFNKTSTFKIRSVNTQLGIPLSHNEEINRYINVSSLYKLLEKQEEKLFNN